MEDYPRAYVEHNLPFVIVSGLENRRSDQPASQHLLNESGARISTASPECRGDKARILLEQLLLRDGSEQPWNASSLPGPVGTLQYRIKPIGRNYTLPPRKAAPLAQSPSADGLPSPTASLKGNELHSPLSPLSPGSPIFPDGVFTPLWITKHQDQVPALVLAFFDLSADDTNSQNEQVQIDINAIRTALARSGYKTKFAAVLLSDKSISEAPGLDDRLTAIRRATTLDSKNGLFFMPPMSTPAEIATFVQGIFTIFQPIIVEFYREMAKHSRRKKSRGGPLPSVSSLGGTSQSLSTMGWNTRYEVKQGVLAEFRQEMESAERFYSAAVEELFNPEGILEATPSWSPRWNEARLLCDILAVRILRCELWAGLTTGAAASWSSHRARMKDLVDRRGKGSETYSWAAWESRWARTMSQLVARAQVLAVNPAKTDSSPSPPYAAPERVFERLLPFHLLHHSGYWQKLAVDGLRVRQRLALDLPEEDRVPQDQLPASAMTNRNQRYDRFMVPDPSEEFTRASGTPVQVKDDCIAAQSRITDDAVKELDARGQIRMSEQLRLELARGMVKLGRYREASDVLLPLWEHSTWRTDDWQALFGEVLSLLHISAKAQQDSKTVLVTTWELLSDATDNSNDLRPNLRTCLSDLHVEEDISISIQDGQRRCPFVLSFAFVDAESHVGETLECQFSLISQAQEGLAPITLSMIILELTPKTIELRHEAGNQPELGSDTLLDLSEQSEEGGAAALFAVPLVFQPGQRRVFNLHLTYTDAQVIRLTQASLVFHADNVKLEHTFTDMNPLRTASVYTTAGSTLVQTTLPRADSTVTTIHPKPPKLQLLVHGLHRQYYTDERLRFDVKLLNEERENVRAVVSAKCVGVEDQRLPVHWEGVDDDSEELRFAEIKASESHVACLNLMAPVEASAFMLSLEVRYSMISDPDTELSKLVDTELVFVNVFDAIFELSPMLDTSPWPSYFVADAAGTAEHPAGIGQCWLLKSKIQSLANEDVSIRHMRLVQDTKPPDALCVMQDCEPGDVRTLASSQSLSTEFTFSTRKLSFDDRRPTSLDLSLETTWSRKGGLETVVTSVPVPRLVLPSSEPRVLCTSSCDGSLNGHVTLHYHLENPSMHFLTFALTMDASDEFAFNGPKYRTLSLAPLSRHCIDYKILLHEEGGSDQVAKSMLKEGRWAWPSLQVVDSYYQKNLKVHSGGSGVKIDEKRGLGVLVA